ncbi:MAG TPA: hypothetical protein VHS58_21095 [Acetobacteraceae bacterium]|nr:hypothetical protein [Acetobacteraceae bacterium]
MTITTNLPGGTPQAYVLTPVPPGGGVPPPPGMMTPPAPLPPAGIPPSGSYTGEMVSVNDPGGRCTPRVPLYNWTVRGTRVRFGGFVGTIRPNGVLNMQQRGSYVSGEFRGPQFVGELWSPSPACDYRMTLQLAS